MYPLIVVGDYFVVVVAGYITTFWWLGSVTLLLSLALLNLLKYFDVVVDCYWFVAEDAVYLYVL